MGSLIVAAILTVISFAYVFHQFMTIKYRAHLLHYDRDQVLMEVIIWTCVGLGLSLTCFVAWWVAYH